ncbi:phiSA1p31-related protein [Streptomyces koyangensis]
MNQFKFKAGDKVTCNAYDDVTFTVLSAHPLWQLSRTPGYLLEHPAGGVLLAMGRSLSAAPASFSKGDSAYLAGVRVAVLSGPHPGAGAFGGDPMYLVGFDDGTARSAPAEELTAEPDYSPAAFPRSARYRDNEGDVWEFTYGELADGGGEARMRCRTYPAPIDMPLRRVLEFYAPLTRI